MSESSVYRMHKIVAPPVANFFDPERQCHAHQPEHVLSRFIITIKNANRNGDVRIGIDEGDNFDNLLRFITNNKDDFDELRELSEYDCIGKALLVKKNDLQTFKLPDFIEYQDLSKNELPQNVDVILIGLRAHIQVEFEGTTHDIHCIPTILEIKKKLLQILPGNLTLDHINLEVIDGDLITVSDRNYVEYTDDNGQHSSGHEIKHSIYINKSLGRTRKLQMSILTDDNVKNILVYSKIPSITIEPIKSIKDKTDQLSGLKLVINCKNHRAYYISYYNYDSNSNYTNYGDGVTSTLLYGIRKGWFDMIELVITNSNGYAYNGLDAVNPDIPFAIRPRMFHIPLEYNFFTEMLNECITSTKKIILSLDISACFLVLNDISKFLEKTTIPTIIIRSPNQPADLTIIEDAISKNQNITKFTGLESDRITASLRLNIERKDLINRVSVQAGSGVKKNIIGFL
jgi:hypothetical protein